MFVMLEGEVINVDDIHRILPLDGGTGRVLRSQIIWEDRTHSFYKSTPGQIQAKIITTEMARFSAQQRIEASFRPHIPMGY